AHHLLVALLLTSGRAEARARRGPRTVSCRCGEGALVLHRGACELLARRGVGRGVDVTDLPAEVRVLGAEDAPRALPRVGRPRVHHPEVVERGLLAAACCALGLARALGADDDGALQAQPAVAVVLVPGVVRPREAFGRLVGIAEDREIGRAYV